jgi:hypothetical protein
LDCRPARTWIDEKAFKALIKARGWVERRGSIVHEFAQALFQNGGAATRSRSR